MLDGLKRWVRKWAGSGTRMYSGARQSRLTGGFGGYTNTSADAELSSSLPQLRARSRQLMRDAPYAKRARVIVVNNVLGGGVGLQAQVANTRGGLNERINESIEAAWRKWCRADSCHTGGTLHFSDLERTALSEVFTTGEVFIRKHLAPFGRSEVPLALELIEAERIADDGSVPYPENVGYDVRMGVEVDPFGRPVAYWVRDWHQGDVRVRVDRTARVVRVPADEMIHLRVVDRWPQTRGEPWLHAVLRKLNDMEEYSGSELTAARMSANYFATIESPDADPLTAEVQADGTKQMDIEPGVIEMLAPGDKLNFHTPNRPNTALDPFMRYMLREVAAGVGVSYESLSRDYSQSNYSSSRLALLDDRDLWRVLQQWWIRSFRDPLHSVWMQQAVYSRAISAIPTDAYAINREQYEAVSWKLRGWSWVDPTKEVAAYKEAVKAGFTTITSVIAQTGGGVDLEDVITERRRELDMLDEAEIEVDTTVPEPVEPAVPAPASAADSEPGDYADSTDSTDSTDAADGQDQPARVLSIAR